jgi:Flp pilus assembly protein TadG
VVGLDWFLIVPLFLGLVLVLVALPQWPERQSGARGAAAEAARAAVLVESPSEVEGVARSVAAEVLTNYGISPDQYSVSVDGTVERGTRIEVTVSILLPVIAVPFGPDIASRSYQAKASEDVEAYREITP